MATCYLAAKINIRTGQIAQVSLLSQAPGSMCINVSRECWVELDQAKGSDFSEALENMITMLGSGDRGSQHFWTWKFVLDNKVAEAMGTGCIKHHLESHSHLESLEIRWLSGGDAEIRLHSEDANFDPTEKLAHFSTIVSHLGVQDFSFKHECQGRQGQLHEIVMQIHR